MRIAGFDLREELLIVTAAIVLVLSCSSADVKLRDSAGNTPLHYAVFNQDISEVKRLVKAGADINASNNYGLTPVRCAAFFNNAEIIDILISGGACLNYMPPAEKKRAVKEPQRNIIRYPEERLNFFLTFDTGSDDSNLDYVLTTLKKYRIKATFFTTGEFVEKYPQGIKRIVREGHVVGNHTYTHNMNYPDPDLLLNELYATEILFNKITGREMTRIWRSPGLQHISKPWVINEAEKLGYRHIDVNLGSADWLDRENPQYINNGKFLQLFKSHLSMAKNSHAIINNSNYRDYYKNRPYYHGTIMLMHVGSFRNEHHDFVYLLDDIIKYLISSGYLFDNCERFEYRD